MRFYIFFILVVLLINSNASKLFYDKKTKFFYDIEKQILFSPEESSKADVNITEAFTYCKNAKFYDIGNWKLPVVAELVGIFAKDKNGYFSYNEIEYWTGELWQDTRDPYYVNLAKKSKLGLAGESSNNNKEDCKTHIVNTVNSKTSKQTEEQCGEQKFTVRCVNHIEFTQLPKIIQNGMKDDYKKYLKEQKVYEDGKKAYYKENERFQKSIRVGTVCANGDKVSALYGEQIKVTYTNYRIKNYGAIMEKWIDKVNCLSPKVSSQDFLKYGL